jgi:hypothetical protein
MLFFKTLKLFLHAGFRNGVGNRNFNVHEFLISITRFHKGGCLFVLYVFSLFVCVCVRALSFLFVFSLLIIYQRAMLSGQTHSHPHESHKLESDLIRKCFTSADVAEVQ